MKTSFQSSEIRPVAPPKITLRVADVVDASKDQLRVIMYPQKYIGSYEQYHNSLHRPRNPYVSVTCTYKCRDGGALVFDANCKREKGTISSKIRISENGVISEEGQGIHEC